MDFTTCSVELVSLLLPFSTIYQFKIPFVLESLVISGVGGDGMLDGSFGDWGPGNLDFDVIVSLIN